MLTNKNNEGILMPKNINHPHNTRSKSKRMRLTQPEAQPQPQLQAPESANVRALVVAGMDKFNKKDSFGALIYLSEAIEQDKNSVFALLTRAEIFFQIKDMTAALLDVKKVLDLQADHVEALKIRAKVFHAKGEFVEASKDIDKLLILSPQDDFSLKLRSSIDALKKAEAEKSNVRPRIYSAPRPTIGDLPPNPTPDSHAMQALDPWRPDTVKQYTIGMNESGQFTYNPVTFFALPPSNQEGSIQRMASPSSKG